jgi:hypothetical protein
MLVIEEERDMKLKFLIEIKHATLRPLAKEPEQYKSHEKKS